jgi:brefeldin A-inhibited guanine nucleotide-exchange protein
MDVFIERTVRKIRKLLGRWDRDKELRESCDEVLSHIKAGTNLSEERLIIPLFLAILSKQVKITCLALECFEKVLALGYFDGSETTLSSTWYTRLQQDVGLNNDRMKTAVTTTTTAMDDGASKHKILLIDAVVEVICSCSDHNHINVQLHVLKAILSAVTSATCNVHERSLLKSICSGCGSIDRYSMMLYI